jgi:hypothetical protein
MGAIQIDPAIQRIERFLISYPTFTQDEERLMALQLIQRWCREWLDSADRVGSPGPYGAAMLVTEQGAIQLSKNIRVRGRWKRIMQTARPIPGSDIEGEVLTNAVGNVSNLRAKQLADVVATISTKAPGGKAVKMKSLDPHSWLEVFDPAHRTTYTTQGYYQQWIKWVTPSTPEKPNPDYKPEYRESFFDYLDKVADRWITRATYLDQEMRKCFAVVVRGNRLYTPRAPMRGERPFTTRGMAVNDMFFIQMLAARNIIQSPSQATGRGMWVVSPDKHIYSGPSFTLSADGQYFINYHHSSFLGGTAILCGGAWEVDGGEIRVISAASGHYKPPFSSFIAALQFFQSQGLDLSKAAGQWPTSTPDAHEYFKVSDLMIPGIRASYPGWPRMIGSGRPLRRVLMRNPSVYVDPENVDPNRPPPYDPMPMAARPAAVAAQPDDIYAMYLAGNV